MKVRSQARPCRGFTSCRGFTLIELLTTITVATILLMIAVPSFRYVTTSNRIAAEANGLMGDLQYARAEAIKEGQTVTACVSTDDATCTGGADWNSGWIVFSDVNGDAKVDSTADAVLRTQTAFSGTDTFQASNAVSAITFNREGLATAVGAGVFNGTLITLHDATDTSQWTRCLSVTLLGLMSSMTAGTTTNGFTCT